MVPNIFCLSDGGKIRISDIEWPLFVDLDWQKIKTLMREPFLVVDGRNALDADQLVELVTCTAGLDVRNDLQSDVVNHKQP